MEMPLRQLTTTFDLNTYRKNMKYKQVKALLFLLCINVHILGAVSQEHSDIRIVWKEGDIKGKIEVCNGKLSQLKVSAGKIDLSKGTFQISNPDKIQVQLSLSDIHISPGPEPTLVTVRTEHHAFSFFLRDVNSANPIYIPEYGVAVVPEKDERSFSQIEKDILSRSLLTKVQQIEKESETSFEKVAPHTRNMSAPIWLGLGRDIRMFEIQEEMPDVFNGEDKMVKPIVSSLSFPIPETNNHHLFYRYALGRGVGALNNIHRWLENGALPIYHSEMKDEDVVYHSVSFASLETNPLTAENVKGIDYYISDSYSPGRVFTPEQQQELESRRSGMKYPEEEIVLYCRTEIKNTGQVPRYAWVKTPTPGVPVSYTFDPESGFSKFSDNRVFCISTLDGKPMYNEELAVLIQPNETVSFEFRLSHNPIDNKRAEMLSEKSFDNQYVACRKYWQAKLDKAAKIDVPEKRISEMIAAGLLHLDINTMGIEPDQPLAAKAGVYSPIGTESAPIIQFYCSMGLYDIARRSLDYFIETQQENGQIMNYHGYTIETGAVLWCISEYFRYSQDEAWIRRIKPQLMKACEFLIKWRNSEKDNKYGMISGKVADPEDSYHQFMLNAYSYLGLSRMAELMNILNEPEAATLSTEARAWKTAIRMNAQEAMEKSPVVPLGDGSWSPTLPPWVEAPGPRSLYQKREKFRSHGTFTGPDAGLGPAYLVFCEIFGSKEPISKTIMTYIAELMCQGNAGFSQPYYGRLNWWQIQMGMVKPFLNAYYTTISAHADRETYTFWEHFFRLSTHKTHEEAGFLMETRWMLYMEQGDSLHLLSAIPRAWMEEGKIIRLDGVKSYFGELKVTVNGVKNGAIEAIVECHSDKRPRTISIRLPHPEGKKAKALTGTKGKYLPEKETVILEDFNGHATVKLEF